MNSLSWQPGKAKGNENVWHTAAQYAEKGIQGNVLVKIDVLLVERKDTIGNNVMYTRSLAAKLRE